MAWNGSADRAGFRSDGNKAGKYDWRTAGRALLIHDYDVSELVGFLPPRHFRDKNREVEL